MTGCRVASIARPAHPLGPSLSTTECGWTVAVEQGRAWADSPERARWATHECVNTDVITTMAVPTR